MATATRTRPSMSENQEGVRPYLINVRQFKTMIDAGIFPDDARVELLGGVLAEKMTRNPPHDFTVGALGKALRRLLPSDWFVREEKTVVLGDYWRPEPDLAVVRAPEERYFENHPAAADQALVVEVAESSYVLDRLTKSAGYAAAKVPVYWVVNLGERVVEVYSDPTGRGKTARYRKVERLAKEDSVPVVLRESQAGTIAVSAFLL